MGDFERTYRGRAQNSCLQVYDVKTKSVSVLARFEHVIEAPMWSKDGSAVLYNCEGKIYRLELETGEVKQVDTGAVVYCNNDHVLSQDGRYIAVSGNTEDSIVSKIYVVPFAAGKETEIVSAPWSYLHGWSPDGSTLAYCAGRMCGEEFEWDIYTCAADGGKETRLTSAPGLNDGAEFSMDGKTIWFNSVRTGLMQVWKMNADGSEQTQMTYDEDMNSWFPHISPDNTKVVYLAYHKEDLKPGDHVPDKQVEIRMMDANGGKPEVLLKVFGGQGTINVNSWSPDSGKFAFVTYEA